MTADNPQDLINALDDLLERERQALLAGEIGKVARIAGEKDAVIARLNAMTPDTSECLAPLQTKVKRNQLLISGALEGIRAVADRLAEMRAVRRSLQTYDQAGALREVSIEPTRQIEKRA